MSTNTQRTIAGLVGDFLASLPAGQSVIVRNLAQHLNRERSGVKNAINELAQAKAITTKADPEDLRRTIAYMTADQRAAWLGDAGAAISTAAGINLDAQPAAAKAAVATQQAAQRRREQPLRFALWNDGAISIEGLARKQLMLSAAAVAQLAHTLAALPEGALQALFESPLKPSFVLHVDGAEYPLTIQQAHDLVAYIESLPSKVIKAAAVSAAAAAGSANRVHRIETPEDHEHA